MSATILKFCDDLEDEIRAFLAKNPNGGRFTLSVPVSKVISIPVMIGTFENEGYDVEYDATEDDSEEWLNFKKSEIRALEGGRFDDDAYAEIDLFSS